MEKILIFIKHHFIFLWRIIELGNSSIFRIIYKQKLEKLLSSIFNEFNNTPFSCRRLKISDFQNLNKLISSQNETDLKYFNPHGFDLLSLRRQYENHSFLMMGAFDKEKMVGYFFLRFFVNKQCFVGRLIDKDYRGKGIGSVMNNIMYHISWRMRFRCMSTISRNNKAVMQAHAKNPTMRIIKELQNEYLLVEFRKETPGWENRY
ncbi:MAG: hypothetical protein JXB49_06165 [Bacteroidales bacterium]|nr:hypothetical protein [Bacteroidales bacterium]